MFLKVNIYKTSTNIEHSKRNSLGQDQVLLNLLGRKSLPAKIYNDPDVFVINIESEETNSILAGLRIHLYNHDQLLPFVHSIPSNDKISNTLGKNSAEINGLWISEKIRGFGIPEILLRLALVFCKYLKVAEVYCLAASLNIDFFQKIGFKPDIFLGINGGIPYPRTDLIAHIMKFNLGSLTDLDSFLMKNKQKRRNQISIKVNETIIDIVYNLQIPKIYSLEGNLSEIDSDLYLKLINNPELIKTINWRKFEKLIADMLETFGYNVQLMQGTKDGGIDVIAFSKNDEFGEFKYLLQAKRWSNNVGIDVVKNVLFNHANDKASKSCIATTSKFTRGAWELADKHKWQMELKDFDAIQNWIQKAWNIKNG